MNKDGYLDIMEFTNNIFRLYSNDFDVRMKLIFSIYDFNNDKMISKDDVILLLSHSPLEKAQKKILIGKEGSITREGSCQEDYSDRAESQKELYNLVNVCFKGKNEMDFETFKAVTEKVNSEMFLCIFSLIKTHLPSLADFKKYEMSIKRNEPLVKTPKSGKTLAGAKVLSKFSPLSQIVRFSTPKSETRSLKMPDFNSPEESKKTKGSYLNRVSGNKSGFAPSKKTSEVNSPMSPAVRLPNTRIKQKEVTDSPSTFLSGKGVSLFCECGKAINDLNKLRCNDCLFKKKIEKCEGWLYVKSGKLCKYWFTLDKKDL